MQKKQMTFKEKMINEYIKHIENLLGEKIKVKQRKRYKRTWYWIENIDRKPCTQTIKKDDFYWYVKGMYDILTHGLWTGKFIVGKSHEKL